MGLTENQNTGINYLSIAKGNLVTKAQEGDEGAVKRTYEDRDGNSKTKWEHQYRAVSGIIENISFEEGDFGEQCIINMVDDGEKFNVCIGTDARYFSDFAKKLPNVDILDPVELSPYDFIDKTGKQVKGLSLKQSGAKIQSYYWDGQKTINGMPEPKDGGKGYNKDQWKIYFLELKIWLKKSIEEMNFSKATLKNEPTLTDDLPF